MSIRVDNTKQELDACELGLVVEENSWFVLALLHQMKRLGYLHRQLALMAQALQKQCCPKRVYHFDQPTYDVLDSLEVVVAELDWLAASAPQLPQQEQSPQLEPLKQA